MAIKKEADLKKEEYRQVTIPKESKYDDSCYVSVNGKSMLVKKGVPVNLPAAFAEVVENSIAQSRAAQAYIDANMKW